MKSSALLPSNLPRVIDRSNLSPRRLKTRNSHGLMQLGREALAYCQCASALISGNKALFVSVDLIGEKNQVILELVLKHRPPVFGEFRSGERITWGCYSDALKCKIPNWT